MYSHTLWTHLKGRPLILIVLLSVPMTAMGAAGAGAGAYACGMTCIMPCIALPVGRAWPEMPMPLSWYASAM
jgi:hypothetical protein